MGYSLAMRPLPCLLRLLLCLALLANGTTTAFANARMALSDVATSTQHAAPPCHEATAAHDAPAAPSASHADCCPPGACMCSCIAQAATLPMPGIVAWMPRPASVSVAARDASRASPALPNLIRPPIG
ncbi:CopL family metal-binding regulatory protein [Lysobacter sp. 2RAF19]